MLSAEEKILELERQIFAELRTFAAAHASRIRATAAAVAELDVTAALAQIAAESRYVRPKFSEDGEMRVAGGRHPVIEKLTEKQAARFIPNDLYLDDKQISRGHHRAEYGRQVDVSAPGGADEHPGADRVVRPGR